MRNGWNFFLTIYYCLLLGLNYLFPEDLVPFTRSPLFLIVDSENSHAFKAGLSWHCIKKRNKNKVINNNHPCNYFIKKRKRKRKTIIVTITMTRIIISAMLLSLFIKKFDNNVQVIHGAERGEPAAMLLSPSVSPSDLTSSGSLFTYFLTAPLQAFCHLVGLSSEFYAVQLQKEYSGTINHCLIIRFVVK